MTSHPQDFQATIPCAFCHGRRWAIDDDGRPIRGCCLAGSDQPIALEIVADLISIADDEADEVTVNIRNQTSVELYHERYDAEPENDREAEQREMADVAERGVGL